MVVRVARYFGFVLLLSSLPVGFALAAGGAAGARSSGGVGAGVGGMGTGSAAVGGGAPAGRVGGGPLAGEVGGGAPGSPSPEGNGAAGTGNPGANARGTIAVPSNNPASGLENAPTTGGVIGASTGLPPATGNLAGGASPSVAGQSQPVTDQPQLNNTVGPKAVEGVAEEPPPSTVGFATPGPDGISTKIVAPRPCGVAAHETDGTTTCVGLPAR